MAADLYRARVAFTFRSLPIFRRRPSARCCWLTIAWHQNTRFPRAFAVEPTVGDYAVSHNYELERDGLRLLFTLWQLESVIQASLFRVQDETAMFTFAAYVRGEARFINDRRGRYIDFEDCI